ncbi:MAG: cobalamin-dependent protein [Gammaproteobacteria bacterium]|nr:cobalamin-dependent protein [Gammaproteobacteria bacterium]
MNQQRRILLAKTGLDGHWRGPSVVAKALRDGGFEVIMIGMTTVDEIVQAALDEDVDLVGLSIGGHIEVAERAVLALREAGIDRPVFAGGVVPPWARKRLEAQGVEVYPPGSQLPDIVAAARRLTGLSVAQ